MYVKEQPEGVGSLLTPRVSQGSAQVVRQAWLQTFPSWRNQHLWLLLQCNTLDDTFHLWNILEIHHLLCLVTAVGYFGVRMTWVKSSA